MIKLYTSTPLLLLFLLCALSKTLGQVGIGALHIGAGTKWVSTTETTVVLDNMDLQYDANPGLLNNTFWFTGQRINSIRGNNTASIYAIGLHKDNPGMVTINQDIIVTKRINFETGYLDLNEHGVYLQPFALLTNENDNGRLIGNFGGFVTIDADLPSPEGVNPGNLGAIITSAGNLGKVTITRGHNVQYLSGTTISIARWYEITPPAGAPVDATLRFTYLNPEWEGFPPDSLVLFQSLDKTTWANIAYTSRNGSQLFVEKTGLTSLGRFTLGLGSSNSTSPPPPPPSGAEGAMLLIGTWSNDFAALNWTVTSEYQNSHFDVERKYSTQSDFAPVGSIPTTAPGGTRSTRGSYAFIDSTVRTAPDDVSYRIHQVSTDGKFTYSNIITLKARGSTSDFIQKLFPTIAVGGRVYIEVGNMPLAKMSFVVVDAKGSIVLSGELPYQSQWLPVHFLGHGVYRLILRNGNQHWHSTFIR